MNIRERNEILEERLISFTIDVNELIENLPNTNWGINLGAQMSRSSLSPSLNYGEVQASGSTKDFIHKMGHVLKELIETNACLKIIKRGNLIPLKIKKTTYLLHEVNELISIFVASVRTSKKKTLI